MVESDDLGRREPALQELARRIEVAMRRGKWTYRTLAAETDVSKTALHNLVRHRRSAPDYYVLKVIVDRLGLPWDDGWEDLWRRSVEAGSSAGGGQDDPVAAGGRCARPVPAQLPADVPAFTGRGAEIAELDGLLTGTAALSATGPPVIALVTGPPGVGKTALAVSWAHGVRGHFPDGQLYVDLRGHGPDPAVSVDQVLAGFLHGLGVEDGDVPTATAGRAALFRTLLSGRRLLVLLDNAASVEQVRQLLPGSGTCAVLVTSRDSFSGLVVRDGAHRVDLDVLPRADALDLLRTLVGDRVDADPEAAGVLADRADRLPLALRIAAELVVGRPSDSLSALASELADESRRLDLLDVHDDQRTALRAVFSWSYQRLPAEAAAMFRMISLHPGPDLDPDAAAALTGEASGHSRALLEQLAHAHLVERPAPGRYRSHDLLHLYATELAARYDSPECRHEALHREVTHYLRRSSDATTALYSTGRDGAGQPGAATPLDPESAREWLETERPSLVAMVAHAARQNRLTEAIDLARTLFRFLAGNHYTDALATHSTALDAARRLHDGLAEAHARTDLATVYGRTGDYATAVDQLNEALTQFRAGHDMPGQVRVLANLGTAHERLGDYRRAADHYGHALALLPDADVPATEGDLRTGLGLLDLRRGRYASARTHYQRALQVFLEAADPDGQAVALTGLGLTDLHEGRLDSAADHHRHALTLYCRLGNRLGEAHCLINLGEVETRHGRFDPATRYHEQALRILRRNGDRAAEAEALNALGSARHGAGDTAGALRRHTTALALAIDTGERHEQARAHHGIARVHQAAGDRDLATDHLRLAQTLFDDLGAPQGAAPTADR